MDVAPRPGRVAEAALLAAVGLVLAWAVLDGDGSRDGALATVGIVAIVCAAVGVALGLRGALPDAAARPGGVVVVAAIALTLWAGLSLSWSIAGDLSWEWLARGLVYLAFLVLGVLSGALAGGARRVAALAALVLAAALGWALLGVAIPSLFPDGDRIARLREPVGYWNALALLADAALALGLWVARSPRSRDGSPAFCSSTARRSRCCSTQSRAGVVGALAALGLWLVLLDERLDDALRAVMAGVPALVVGGWAFTRPALVEDGALRADRVADGKVFAALTIAGAILVVLAAWRFPVRRLVDRHGSAVRTALVGLCVLAVAVGSIGLVAKVGNPYSWARSQLSRGECVNEPGGSPTSVPTTGCSGGERRSTSRPTGRSAARVRARSRSRDGATGRARRPSPSRTASRSSCSPTSASLGSYSV